MELKRTIKCSLDESYETEIEQDINTMQEDEITMVSLIKNQSSIMLTFLTTRISEDISKQQLDWVSSNLEVISNEQSGRGKSSRTQHSLSTQTAIIQAITN